MGYLKKDLDKTLFACDRMMAIVDRDDKLKGLSEEIATLLKARGADEVQAQVVVAEAIYKATGSNDMVGDVAGRFAKALEATMERSGAEEVEVSEQELFELINKAAAKSPKFSEITRTGSSDEVRFGAILFKTLTGLATKGKSGVAALPVKGIGPKRAQELVEMLSPEFAPNAEVMPRSIH